MIYYAAEVQNYGSFRKAEKLKATNLRAAKREASLNQVFQGTTLVLGTDVNEDGFILDPIARKEDGQRWEDM